MEQQDLLELKEKIDKAKEKSSELKGELKSLTKELKDDWQCDTIKEAEKKIETMESEITVLNEKINTGVTKLEEEYDV